MNTVRQIFVCLPWLAVLGLLAVAPGCATHEPVERTDPINGSKSYSTTVWSSEKTGPTVTPDDVKKAAQQPK